MHSRPEQPPFDISRRRSLVEYLPNRLRNIVETCERLAATTDIQAHFLYQADIDAILDDLAGHGYRNDNLHIAGLPVRRFAEDSCSTNYSQCGQSQRSTSKRL